jgi:hypothetical protein
MKRLFAATHESVVGTKRTSHPASPRSVLGGKADLTVGPADFPVGSETGSHRRIIRMMCLALAGG